MTDSMPHLKVSLITMIIEMNITYFRIIYLSWQVFFVFFSNSLNHHRGNPPVFLTKFWYNQLNNKPNMVNRVFTIKSPAFRSISVIGLMN